MEKVKKILTGIGIVAVILIWWGWDARSDYTWSKLIVDEKSKDGWIVGTTQANLVDITRPWTIFKQPVVRIAFLRPSEFVKLDNELVFAKTLWVYYENMSRTEEDVFQNIHDCKNNRTAFVESDASIEYIDFAKLEWRDNANTSSVGIAKVVCK